MAFTGREPQAIPGVTLPLAVILTAHRLQPSRRPARQTASSFGGGGWLKAESQRLKAQDLKGQSRKPETLNCGLKAKRRKPETQDCRFESLKPKVKV